MTGEAFGIELMRFFDQRVIGFGVVGGLPLFHLICVARFAGSEAERYVGWGLFAFA